MATPPHNPVAPPFARFAPRKDPPAQSPASMMNIRWLALHDAAGVVATLAGLPHGKISAQDRNFPAIMRDAGDWRRNLAEQGIDDLSAIMQAGISALLGLHAKGASPVAPARALWDEFNAARTALLALAPPAAV